MLGRLVVGERSYLEEPKPFYHSNLACTEERWKLENGIDSQATHKISITHQFIKLRLADMLNMMAKSQYFQTSTSEVDTVISESTLQ